MLNKQKGNMYGWVTHTWNPIKGTCPHDCSYCYMKRFPQGELRFDEKCMNDNLKGGNTIFVGSSTDMFANAVSTEWIDKVLEHCNKFKDNTYLFQTKNPERFRFHIHKLPPKHILGTTIESTSIGYSKAPHTVERMRQMEMIEGRKMISIEPIWDFNLRLMLEWIRRIKPEFVSIGADSKGSNLPEPPKENINALITELLVHEGIEVKIKDNLKRLLR